MINQKTCLFLSLFIAIISCKSKKQSDVSDRVKPTYVIMVSFDGFRYDYAQKYNAQNFLYISKNGISTESLIPSFPSKTFPNHYTLVTGLYPGNHNIVDNTFFDENLNMKYEISNRKRVENPVFYGGLPVWQLAQKNGMKSASCFWVGSEAPIKGSYPDYWKKYNPTMPNNERIKTVENWLNLPQNQRPRLITLYFSLVDSKGHKYGPDAVETQEAVKEADKLVGKMLNMINNMTELDINLIIVSDHGMQSIAPRKENFISEKTIREGIDYGNIRFYNNGTHIQIYMIAKNYKEELYTILKGKENHFKVYKKEDLPKHWNYQHESVGDIFIAADPSYYFASEKKIDKILKNKHSIGTHGYDPSESKDMHGIFYAIGPNIKKGKSISSFENIHVYPFVAKLLGIDSLPQIDGNPEILSSYIKKSKNR